MKSLAKPLLLVLSALWITGTSPAQESNSRPSTRPTSDDAIPMTRAQRDANEGRLMTGIRQLTYAGLRAGEGYFSADGKSMIFQSERNAENPFYQIHLLDLETGDVTRVSPGIGKTTCAWIHPSGKKVLYASTHQDPLALVKMKNELDFRRSGQTRRYAWDYDDSYDLFDHDLATKEVKNLTQIKGYDAEGSYSPDGQWIAFASNRHAYVESLTAEDQQRFAVDKSLFMDIYIMKADGSHLRRLTTTRGYDGGPFFSSDGQRICWRRFNEAGVLAEIYTMKVDGSDQKQITRINAMSWAPYYHPSGKYLVFATNKHGFANFEVYLVDVEGRGEPQRITWTAGFDGLPTFSPDGKTIAWTSNRTPKNKSQIFMARWNHDRALELLRRSIGIKDGEVRTAAVSRPKIKALGSKATGFAFARQRLLIKTSPAITKEDLKVHLETLASEATQGRFTGSIGEKIACYYAALRFQEMGLRGVKVPTTGGDTPLGKDFPENDPRVALALPYLQSFKFGTQGGHDGARKITGIGTNVAAALWSQEPGRLPAIVIGAHIDHLGQEGISSRSSGENKKKTHHGADDNASGVAALIELAEYLVDLHKTSKLKLERDLIFCCWSGEELGLFGSNAFVKTSWEKAGKPESLKALFGAYLNMDMVGRFKNKLTIQGVGSSSIWRGEIEKRNVPVGLPIALNDDVYLPTDTMPFYLKGIPILAAFTGAHTDYHKHTDTIEKINYDGLKQVTHFMALMTRGLAIRQADIDYIYQERTVSRSASASQGIYLGTIPDYAEAPIPGLQLSGVSKGGPAEKAGIKSGDIIVRLAGKKVTDIHTYMAAFAACKIGKASAVVVVRDGKKVELTIIPGRRD